MGQRISSKVYLAMLEQMAANGYNILFPPRQHPPVSADYVASMIWNVLTVEGRIHIGKADLPDIRDFYGWSVFPYIYADSMVIHHLYHDVYSLDYIKKLEAFGYGPYCYEELVKPKPGDVVIDAGAYIGDFSAVAASAYGADVYAFEPCQRNFGILSQTAEMNNFHAINMGLGDVEGTGTLRLTTDGTEDSFVLGATTNTQTAQITTIDEFINRTAIPVNFIKSSTVGYDEKVIKGAVEIIANYSPKIAVRTYNVRTDPTRIQNIIKGANPNYVFIQRPDTLYAYVPSA